MKSKITFLGTAGDTYTYAKQFRGSGGIVINIDEAQFHIDPGPGALVKAAENNINIRENTCLLISHNHIGHCNDVNAVIDAMTYSGLDKKGILICNSDLMNGQNKYLTDFHTDCVERIMIVEPGKKIGIEQVDIIGMEAKHGENSLGFKFITPYFTLGYTGDTKFTNEIAAQYKGSDILIMNITAPSGIKVEGHLNSDDAVKLIEKIKPKLAIITHFGLKMLKSDPIYEAREIQKKTKTQVIAAKDGMVVSPGNYAAKAKQQNLLNIDQYQQ